MFTKLKEAIDLQMLKMQQYTLLITNVDRDIIWETYIKSFPEGTNPIYKERTEHDCQCCKAFIRKAGGIVAIIDGELVSIWDLDYSKLPSSYATVAKAMSEYVKSQDIKNKFMHYEPYVGTDKSRQDVDGEIITWKHFYHKLPTSCVVAKTNIPTRQGKIREQIQTTARAFDELTLEAINTVIELIEQNSIYKGTEYLKTVKEFKAMKASYENSNNELLFLWSKDIPLAISGIRNTSIGTLLVDLSDGMDLNAAVARYEAKVAPENYKRPTALITQGMIKKAQETVVELGYEESLPRRFANIDDITVANTLWSNRDAKKAMGVFEEMSAAVPDKKPNLDKIEDVTIGDFIKNILPKAESLELMVEGNHQNNLVSLIAPVNADAPNIMKWNNNFSWSYKNEVTDAMKERVKTAGGAVDGILRGTIQWNEEGDDNTNDLDIHCNLPNSHIYYGHSRDSKSGGWLDIDITNPKGQTSDGIAVENISWQHLHKMPDGDYKFFVHNFSGRNTGGFRAQIEMNGVLHEFSYDRSVTSDIPIATVTLKKDKFTIKCDLKSSTGSKEIWGIHTNKFQKVSMVMNSPNFWDGQTNGNQHWFFKLADCVNPDDARGFYNEFLPDELYKHRKVFEMLGSKLKAKQVPEQLSGLGFSATKNASVVCKVTGAFSRVINIKF